MSVSMHLRIAEFLLLPKFARQQTPQHQLHEKADAFAVPEGVGRPNR